MVRASKAAAVISRYIADSSSSCRCGYSLAMSLLRLDANVPVLHFRALRLEADISGGWKVVLGDMRQQRPVQIIPDLVPLGNDFDCIPLASGIPHFLAQFIIKREH